MSEPGLPGPEGCTCTASLSSYNSDSLPQCGCCWVFCFVFCLPVFISASPPVLQPIMSVLDPSLMPASLPVGPGSFSDAVIFSGFLPVFTIILLLKSIICSGDGSWRRALCCSCSPPGHPLPCLGHVMQLQFSV